MDAIKNPLYGVQTGSIVFGDTGKFSATVLGPGITRFINQQSTTLSMTGNSDYNYTDKMNQGSFGVSGSYGVSGVSKLSASVSAYVGHTTSSDSKTLSISLNCAKAAGIEYIDFDSLDVEALMAALKPNIKADLKDVLAKFLAASAVPTDAAKRTAWSASVESFTQRHGTGLVVGTLWGGLGAVQLKFTKGGSSNAWVYGGAGDFSYAGTGASVSINATYGGSTKTLGNSATVDLTAYSNGACVDSLVNQWFKELQTLATEGLDKLGAASVSSPTMSQQINPPKAPDFVQPKDKDKDPTVAGMIKEIKDLDGLKAFAQASAFDKYKKGGGKGDLNAWLSDSQQKNDTQKEIKTDPETILVGEDDESEGIIGAVAHIELVAVQSADAGGDAHSASDPFAAYEPMGVWIANWSQLFPWLVSGHSNEIPKNSTAATQIQLKVMHQDFLTLGKLYNRFSMNPNADFRVISMTRSDFASIANAFSNGAAAIATFIAQQAAGAAGQAPTATAMIKDRLAALDLQSRKIYDLWNKLGFLRGAELGFGITIQAQALANWAPHSFRGFNKTGTQQIPVLEPCPFNGKNFSVFADFVKGWPCIYHDPSLNQTFLTCYVEGPDAHNCGFLAQDPQFANSSYNFYVWHGLLGGGGQSGSPGRGQLVFYEDNNKGGSDDPFDNKSSPDNLLSYLNLTGGAWEPNTVRLWPIPYIAANGIPWKGVSMATGTGDMQDKLTNLVAILGNMTRWTLDDEYWKDRGTEFIATGGYSLPSIETSYIGLMTEPSNVFAKS